MFKRLYFPLVVLFWAIMNVLLWRSEMSGNRDAGSPVPAAVVWDRIVTAPDNSSLEVRRDGQKVGYCRWIPVVGEAQAPERPDAPESGLEGRIRGAASYAISLDGNLRVPEFGHTLRFSGQAELTGDQLWRQFSLRLNLRPGWIDVKGDFDAETVRFQVEGSEAPFERTYSFAELRQPDAVLASLGLPFAGVLIEQMSGVLGMGTEPGRPMTLGLDWQASTDWMRIGEARARVYRLRARLFDQYEAVVVVSRVGELLRIELPGGWLLINEALLNLGGQP